MGSFIELMNDCGKMFVSTTGLMLIQSSVLIAILFGLDLLLRRHIRAVFRYSLWMLVLIKLVLPSSLSMPFSMGYWLSNAYDRVESSLPDAANPPHTPTRVAIESSFESTEIVFDKPALQISATTKDSEILSMTNQLQRTDNMVVPPPEAVDRARDRAVALTWQAVLFGLWLVVCMGTGLLVMRKTLLLKRLVRQALPANKGLVGLFESCRKRMLIGRDIGLRVSSVVPTPAVYGFFRPIVLIPERMICHDFETRELEAIFTHELVHIQRCDLWVKLLQTILQVVYFYNPLLWLANATIRRVRELAVDEAVLVILGQSRSEVYPCTLLKVAGWALDQPMHGLGLIGVMESNNLLTERIDIMLQKPIPHSKKIGIIGLGILFVLGVFLLPMARAGGIQKAPEEVAPSKTENVKDAKEIEAIKASIDSLQLVIQMKLDELREKQAELELLREALNVKINSRGGSETTPDATGFVFAAVTPSDAGLSPAGSRGKQTGGWVAIRSNGPTEPGVKPPGVGLSPAGSRGKQPSGGMMMAAVPSSSSARNPGSQPTGGRVPAAFSMPPGPGVGTSATSSSSARTRGKQPSGGGMMMGALAMPREPRVLGEDALPKDISDEVRKELLRILPGLLREMLPKLLKEAQTRTVESPSLIEQF
ncbi:MAG: M56 family metallopeptidase [Planctomycetota bacterium]|jgi:beta-lactamase regulating signal transducer with metallopeptidase domain